MADEQRTERATPRRKEKALERGQLARSRELPSALTLLGVAVLLHWGQSSMLPAWRTMFRTVLMASIGGPMISVAPLTSATALAVVRWAAPPLLLAWCVSAMGFVTQGGFVFSPLALSPKWERLNPANNIGRIFSLAGLAPLMKSLIPVAVLIYLAMTIVARDWLTLIHSSQMGLPASLSWLFSVLYEFSWKGGLTLLVWSGADYGLQRWNFERSLRMTKQEVREEYKDLQGNPATRGRTRRKQREIRRRQMLHQVSRATVVITNPDEYAVALEYIPQKMAAPVVVAKGRNALAQKIKREARWYEVPIVENRPLAQGLYKTVQIGGTIPAKLYTAVAEVLAFIYRAQARAREEAGPKKSGAGASTGAPAPPQTGATRPPLG